MLDVPRPQSRHCPRSANRRRSHHASLRQAEGRVCGGLFTEHARIFHACAQVLNEVIRCAAVAGGGIREEAAVEAMTSGVMHARGGLGGAGQKRAAAPRAAGCATDAGAARRVRARLRAAPTRRHRRGLRATRTRGVIGRGAARLGEVVPVPAAPEHQHHDGDDRRWESSRYHLALRGHHVATLGVVAERMPRATRPRRRPRPRTDRTRVEPLARSDDRSCTTLRTNGSRRAAPRASFEPRRSASALAHPQRQPSDAPHSAASTPRIRTRRWPSAEQAGT